MTISKSISSSAFLCIILTSTSPLQEQFDPREIAGTMMDQTRSAVPNVPGAIKNLSTNKVRSPGSLSPGAYLVLDLEWAFIM
jgi:hypothetical protein